MALSLRERSKRALKRMRSAPTAHYADKDGDGRWVTIGAQKSTESRGKGKSKVVNSGGARVFIGPGGEIKKGPKSLTGKKVGDLDKGKSDGAKKATARENLKKAEGGNGDGGKGFDNFNAEPNERGVLRLDPKEVRKLDSWNRIARVATLPDGRKVREHHDSTEPDLKKATWYVVQKPRKRREGPPIERILTSPEEDFGLGRMRGRGYSAHYQDNKNLEGGRWVTIGKGEGGSPVYIKGGRIEAGGGKLNGKNLSDVKNGGGRKGGGDGIARLRAKFLEIKNKKGKKAKTAASKPASTAAPKADPKPFPAKRAPVDEAYEKRRAARENRAQAKLDAKRASQRPQTKTPAKKLPHEGAGFRKVEPGRTPEEPPAKPKKDERAALDRERKERNIRRAINQVAKSLRRGPLPHEGKKESLGSRLDKRLGGVKTRPKGELARRLSKRLAGLKGSGRGRNNWARLLDSKDGRRRVARGLPFSELLTQYRAKGATN